MSAVNQTPHTWSIFIHVYKPFGRSWPLFHPSPQWIQFLLAEAAWSISVECFISLKMLLLFFLFLSFISISTTENDADVVLSLNTSIFTYHIFACNWTKTTSTLPLQTNTEVNNVKKNEKNYNFFGGEVRGRC